jgi:hypothetical protein
VGGQKFGLLEELEMFEVGQLGLRMMESRLREWKSCGSLVGAK